MKPRQYKKLCKKAAILLGIRNCDVEDGIYFFIWRCGGYDEEWDSEDTWPHLVSFFQSDVNTMLDENSECGISWKPEHESVKATTRNVLQWAKSKKPFPNSFNFY